MNQFKQRPAGDKGWVLSLEDSDLIQELGRELHSELLAFAKAKGSLHIKIVVGAINYLRDILDEKMYALTTDVVLSQKLIEDNQLGDRINEPYEVTEDIRAQIMERQKQTAMTLSEVPEAPESTDNA